MKKSLLIMPAFLALILLLTGCAQQEEKTCTITSYWPSSGVVKDKLEVIIQ